MTKKINFLKKNVKSFQLKKYISWWGRIRVLKFRFRKLNWKQEAKRWNIEIKGWDNNQSKHYSSSAAKTKWNHSKSS